MAWKFDLGEPVEIDISGERGTIIGRAEYEATVPQYLVLLKAADGRAVTQWWEADFISSAHRPISADVDDEELPRCGSSSNVPSNWPARRLPKKKKKRFWNCTATPSE